MSSVATAHSAAEGKSSINVEDQSHSETAQALLLKDKTMSTYPPLALPPAAAGSSSLNPSDYPIAGSGVATTSNSNTTHDIELNLSASHIDENHEEQEVIETSPSRPRSVMDFAIDSTSMHAGGRQVRRNVMARLSGRWTTVPRRSRVILIWSAVMTALKVKSNNNRGCKTERLDCLWGHFFFFFFFFFFASVRPSCL
jgi:hypothetical protein